MNLIQIIGGLINHEVLTIFNKNHLSWKTSLKIFIILYFMFMLSPKVRKFAAIPYSLEWDPLLKLSRNYPPTYVYIV